MSSLCDRWLKFGYSCLGWRCGVGCVIWFDPFYCYCSVIGKDEEYSSTEQLHAVLLPALEKRIQVRLLMESC